MSGANARALQASNGGTLRLNNTVVSADGLNGMGVQSLASTGVTNTFDFANTSITAANGRAITVQDGNTQIDLKDSHVSGETLLSISNRQLTDGTSRASEDVLIPASRSQLSGYVQAEALNSRVCNWIIIRA